MSEYGRKLVSAEYAASLVKDGMWLDFGTVQAPRAFDRALAERVGDLKNVKIRALGHLTPLEVMEKDPEAKSFWLGNWHILGWTRKYIAENRGTHIPYNFGETARIYREDIDVDMAVQTVTPMNKHGYFNFGPLCNFKKAVFSKAKIKVVEVMEDMPWCYGGYDECIHISEVDWVIENKTDKLVTIPSPVATDTEKKIAEYIADMIPKDGPCIQIGIGGLPDTVLRLLADSGVHDVGIHTEMVTEAMMELHEAGLITGKKKTFLPEKIVWAFSIGSRKLYDWLDHNPALAIYPVEFTNDPNIIAMNKDLISINACLGVDLQGQVSSESIGPHEYSGTGGQLAFVRGAYYRATKGQPPLGYPGNKSILAFPSTYRDKEGKLRSRINPTLPPGEIVTVPRVDVSYLVTEYGVAYLKGLSIPERVLAITKLAHPDFRDGLLEEARKMHWLNKQWSLGAI
ncbi:MAG TPA: acetyl-CoA hydrolase/transferase C-terminal domain-containing protein [Syntrophales bacterium]|nr:acetyl-CoA hydrolase/transferase C-terminal domain-containing protein [Syntrophales bacterium]HOM07384.1 acetyl-CoA hydrolase/transferase C-terminal domain-containing protein [Syntrophales bacterium]HON99957.1 acetyl-CoA hydrolase/transferase C-terminal domain-containing protein [Syntrophales bacterium]HPC01476.1 acetyl-CoA hydrolase/transferase C-terminal domain-containing protein [Syntrophales bacterium]HPQ07026.1 acetyl-CoA hydrolase/transferase C-terminal domain-containing protein [Syntr